MTTAAVITVSVCSGNSLVLRTQPRARVSETARTMRQTRFPTTFMVSDLFWAQNEVRMRGPVPASLTTGWELSISPSQPPPSAFIKAM